MFLELCLTGFLTFLKTAIFTVGYITTSAIFPEPLTAEEEKEELQKMKKRR